MILIIALVLLLAPTQTVAQTKTARKGASHRKSTAQEATPGRWPIQSLTVEGNHTYTNEQILSITGLKVGQVAGKPEFEAGRDRLVETGGFERVEYKFGPSKDSSGYAASFQVVEAGPVYTVVFDGLEAPAAELSAWLKSKDPLFGPKIPATSAVLEHDAKLIQEFLEARKIHDKIAGKLTPTGPDQFVIVFRSSAPLQVIAQVKFEGNKALPDTKLQNTISAVAYGFPYTESGFRTLLDNSIRKIYEAAGRIRVAFPKTKVESSKDANVNGLLVTVTVDEGPVFNLGTVQITGNHAVNTADLVKVGAFKPGEVANFDQISESVDRIKKRLYRQGYMRAEATVERKINEKPGTVDIVVRLNEGPQFTFGTLSIEGLNLDGEAAVKKLWALKPGKPYNGDYPDYFLQRIKEDGIFENLHKTKAAVKVNEETKAVDVTLQFQ
jgi:outer membrane protein insertion porin family